MAAMAAVRTARRFAIIEGDTGMRARMDLHERRFLMADDRAYLDEIELTLARVYHIPPERIAVVVRELGHEIQHARMRGDRRPPGLLLPYGGAAKQSEILAALLTS